MSAPHPCVYSNRLGTGHAGAGRGPGISDPGLPLQDGHHCLLGHSPHGESCVSSWHGDPGEEPGTSGLPPQPRVGLTETQRDKGPSPRSDADLDGESEPVPLEGNRLSPVRLAGSGHRRGRAAALRAWCRPPSGSSGTEMVPTWCPQRTSLLESKQLLGRVWQRLLLHQVSVSPTQGRE